jgi:DNA polymerase-3 subunit alpha
MNKKSLEALIKSGALDAFDERATLLHNVPRILDRIKGTQQQAASGGGLFAMEAIEGADLALTKVPPFSLMDQLQQEFSVFKTLISAHPFDGMYGYLRGKYTFISMMKDVEGYGEYHILGMIKSISR